MAKDLFFYSNYCNYSKEIHEELTKTKLIDNMIKVCVDDKNINIPKFITAVPTIFSQKTNSIIIDENINKWINENKPKEESTLNVDSFSNSNNAFSFLESDNNTLSNTFSYLDQDITINTPTDENLKKRTVQDLESERARDLKTI